jgi:DNA repair protein RecO (recombination protein O)
VRAVREIVKDRAVVLKTFDYGETSLVVTMLTRLGGKAGFLAKGARRAGSRMHGRFRTGNIGDIVYYDKPGGALKLIKEYSSEPIIDSTGTDLERLCIFQAGLELAGRISAGDEQGGSVFDLVEGFIDELAEGGDPWIVLFAFETGLLQEAGLMPAISRCDRCKNELAGCGFSLNPSDGAVECDRCSPPGGSLSGETCDLLRVMVAEGFGGVRGTSLGEGVRKEIGTLLHRLMKYHVDGYRLPGSLGMLKGAG